MSAWVKNPQSWRLKGMSALVRTADMVRRDRQEEECLCHRAFQFRGCKACRRKPSTDLTRRANQFVLSEMVCPAPFAKIFFFPPDPNHFTDSPRPVPQRGVSRSSRTLGTGCGGRGGVGHAT